MNVVRPGIIDTEIHASQQPARSRGAPRADGPYRPRGPRRRGRRRGRMDAQRRGQLLHRQRAGRRRQPVTPIRSPGHPAALALVQIPQRARHRGPGSSGCRWHRRLSGEVPAEERPVMPAKPAQPSGAARAIRGRSTIRARPTIRGRSAIRARPRSAPGQRTRKVSPREAALQLAERDPVLARLVADAGLPSFPVPTETHFATLVRAITYQQLAGDAARAIHGRLIAALGDEVAPERLLALSDEALASRRPVGQQGRLAARPVGQGARRHGRARAAAAGTPERRGDRGAPDERARHRPLDRRDLPHVPAAAPGRLADGRPRRAPWLRSRLGRSDADSQGARPARRAVSPVSQRRRLVLLARGRPVCRR